MIIAKKPRDLRKSQTAGGRSPRLWVTSQSSYMRQSSSQAPSMKACSSPVSCGARAANNFSNFGLPVNSSPSHQTVPASSASFSVCDMVGSRRM
jgi:hypothetical protein